MDETPDEILARVLDRQQGNYKPGEKLAGDQALYAWALLYGIRPGRSVGLESEDMWRHADAWAQAEGHTITIDSLEFGKFLKQRLGLKKTRTHAGRDRRPYLVDQEAAQRLQAWLQENPKPGGPSQWCLRNKKKESHAESQAEPRP